MRENHENIGEILMGGRIESVPVKKNKIVSSVQNFVKSGVLFVVASFAPISGCEDGSFDSGRFSSDMTQGVKEADVETEPNEFQFPIFMTLGSEGLSMSGLTEEPITILVQIFDGNNDLLEQEGFVCDGDCELDSILIPDNAERVEVLLESVSGENKEIRSFNYRVMMEDSPTEAPGI
ncbi:MAG: hypothetical protein RBS56_04365 [Candidatus Gracilibacteria bacterium]|jgi:hypothetical protein|nr:hypothetical protein [Candidatus Gracilibacteria bacterium]